MAGRGKSETHVFAQRGGEEGSAHARRVEHRVLLDEEQAHSLSFLPRRAKRLGSAVLARMGRG